MRLVLLSLIINLLTWILALDLVPVTLPWRDLVIDSSHALFALSLFSTLIVVDSLWSWWQLRSLPAAKSRIEVLTREASAFESRLTELRREKEFSDKAVKEMSDKLRDAEERELSVRSALETEVKALKHALAQAESNRVAAVKQSEAGREVVHFLSRLQEKGRFVDFVMEDVGGYTDQQIGSAARFVHDGCRTVVREYLELGPVQEGKEGGQITIDSAEQTTGLRFIGRSATRYPVTGRLVHRGWKITRASFPEISSAQGNNPSSSVIAPAEVELQ